MRPSRKHGDFEEQKKDARSSEVGLTPRQRQVLQLIAEGHRMKKIADLLHVSEKTVEYHKYRLMKSHNLSNSVDLVRFAIDHDLIAP